jgi:hypothetical protein
MRDRRDAVQVQRHAADCGAAGAADVGWAVGEDPVDLEGPLPGRSGQGSGHGARPGRGRPGLGGGTGAARGQQARDHHGTGSFGAAPPHPQPGPPRSVLHETPPPLRVAAWLCRPTGRLAQLGLVALPGSGCKSAPGGPRRASTLPPMTWTAGGRRTSQRRPAAAGPLGGIGPWTSRCCRPGGPGWRPDDSNHGHRDPVVMHPAAVFIVALLRCPWQWFLLRSFACPGCRPAAAGWKRGRRGC